ncbi:MAG TPA: hypothetical protein VK431_05250, partial [Nitrosopumilaceae archaeon]|nr:hypothetical protein [Nitrosopumilaceae archaeon]
RYTGNASLVVDMNPSIAYDSSFKPMVYLQHNAPNVEYGIVSLVVNKTTVLSEGGMFGNASYVLQMDWPVPKSVNLSHYNISFELNFYDRVYKTNDARLHVFPTTKTEKIADLEKLQPVKDNDAIVSIPYVMYSSMHGNNDLQYTVISPDGTCVIGDKFDCIVKETNVNNGIHYLTVKLEGQEYKVDYSGPENSIQRFSIQSDNGITGIWKVLIEKGGSIQSSMMQKTNLKIKYKEEISRIHLSSK